MLLRISISQYWARCPHPCVQREGQVSEPAPRLWTKDPQRMMKRKEVSKLRFRNYISWECQLFGPEGLRSYNVKVEEKLKTILLGVEKDSEAVFRLNKKEFSGQLPMCGTDMGTIGHRCQTWPSLNPSEKKGVEPPKGEVVPQSQKRSELGRVDKNPSSSHKAPLTCPRATLTTHKDKENDNVPICMTLAEEECIFMDPKPLQAKASPLRLRRETPLA